MPKETAADPSPRRLVGHLRLDSAPSNGLQTSPGPLRASVERSLDATVQFGGAIGEAISTVDQWSSGAPLANASPPNQPHAGSLSTSHAQPFHPRWWTIRQPSWPFRPAPVDPCIEHFYRWLNYDTLHNICGRKMLGPFGQMNYDTIQRARDPIYDTVHGIYDTLRANNDTFQARIMIRFSDI